MTVPILERAIEIFELRGETADRHFGDNQEVAALEDALAQAESIWYGKFGQGHHQLSFGEIFRRSLTFALVEIEIRSGSANRRVARDRVTKNIHAIDKKIEVNHARWEKWMRKQFPKADNLARMLFLEIIMFLTVKRKLGAQELIRVAFSFDRSS